MGPKFTQGLKNSVGPIAKSRSEFKAATLSPSVHSKNCLLGTDCIFLLPCTTFNANLGKVLHYAVSTLQLRSLQYLAMSKNDLSKTSIDIKANTRLKWTVGIVRNRVIRFI